MALYSCHSCFQILASRAGFSTMSRYVCLLSSMTWLHTDHAEMFLHIYNRGVPIFLHSGRGYHVVFLGQKSDVIYLWTPWGQELCLLHLSITNFQSTLNKYSYILLSECGFDVRVCSPIPPQVSLSHNTVLGFSQFFRSEHDCKICNPSWILPFPKILVFLLVAFFFTLTYLSLRQFFYFHFVDVAPYHLSFSFIEIQFHTNDVIVFQIILKPSTLFYLLLIFHPHFPVWYSFLNLLF